MPESRKLLMFTWFSRSWLKISLFLLKFWIRYGTYLMFFIGTNLPYVFYFTITCIHNVYVLSIKYWFSFYTLIGTKGTVRWRSGCQPFVHEITVPGAHCRSCKYCTFNLYVAYSLVKKWVTGFLFWLCFFCKFNQFFSWYYSVCYLGRTKVPCVQSFCTSGTPSFSKYGFQLIRG